MRKISEAAAKVIAEECLSAEMIILQKYIESFPEREAYIKEEFDEVRRVRAELEALRPEGVRWTEIVALLPANGWVEVMEVCAQVLVEQVDSSSSPSDLSNYIRKKAQKKLEGKDMN